MKRYFIFSGLLLLVFFGSQSAFAQEKDRKKKSPVKQRLEQVKNDPETSERAAKADVYMVKKHRKIHDRSLQKSSKPPS